MRNCLGDARRGVWGDNIQDTGNELGKIRMIFRKALHAWICWLADFSRN